MALPHVRQMPLAGLRYAGRRHPTVNNGKALEADVMILHFTVGSGSLDALHRFFSGRSKEASYNLAIDAEGAAGEMVDARDAAWGQGDGWCPSAEEITSRGFVPVADVPKPPKRYTNLRTYCVAFVNRGPVSAEKAIALRRDGRPVVEARHRNPACRSTRWEGYTEEAIGSFVATLAAITKALPSLRIVMGHEDVTNGYIFGGGKWKGGSKIDPGPAFPYDAIPWQVFGLQVARYDFREQGWRLEPQVGMEASLGLKTYEE